jgi:type 1 glutamine amidotransferase
MPPLRTAAAVRTASVVIAGDDVYEDLFTASVELQDLLSSAGFVTSVRLGTARFAHPIDDDLVVLYRAAGTFTAAERRGLAEAVAARTGLLVVHSSAVFDDDPELLVLLGARYLDHGPQPHESRFPVEFAEHAVTAGIALFALTHEHYRVEIADGAQVIGWRRAPYGREPLVVVNEFGEGRVCFVQFGHDQRAWAEPGVRGIIAAASGWLTERHRTSSPSDSEKED